MATSLIFSLLNLIEHGPSGGEERGREEGREGRESGEVRAERGGELKTLSACYVSNAR